MSGADKVRELAASRGYILVKGHGRVAGRRDYGKYGLKAAKSGAEAFGFGNRGVTASLAEVERFLGGGDARLFDASLRESKTRKRP